MDCYGRLPAGAEADHWAVNVDLFNRRLLSATVALVIAVSACGGGDSGSGSQADSGSGSQADSASGLQPVSSGVDPVEARKAAEARSVVVTGDGCGDAGDALGSGVAISDDRVLTAAHVVIGASDVSLSRRDDHPAVASVSGPDGASRAIRSDETFETIPAKVIAFDPLRDLALLEADLPALSISTPEPGIAVLTESQTGTIVGGLTSGNVDFTVADKTIIDANEVRGDRRSRRSGYRLDAETTKGDSGAGLYDEAGNLVGLLFAVSTEDSTRSWATAGDELEAFLEDESVAGRFSCNQRRSKLERR